MEKILHFDTDYMRGAHPEVLRRLIETNMEQTPGYGTDRYTAEAKKLILDACELSQGAVQLLVGGTQTNATVIDALLRRHEGVIAAETAHINVHEAGAIEATGHKVLTLPSHEGKLLADEVERYITDFYADDTFEHMVAPGMVYISHPTELGTLYSETELEALARVCNTHGIPLYLDGARLGYALAAQPSLSLPKIAWLTDIFYIGGTKVGALFGEAVVTRRPELLHHFLPLVKQHGALMAKGRLSGLQFATLFTDNLYTRIAANAISTAMQLKWGFVALGFKPLIDSPTNQQFFVLPNTVIDRLAERCTFELWGARGKEESAVRFVTDWATTTADVDNLLEALRNSI